MTCPHHWLRALPLLFGACLLLAPHASAQDREPRLPIAPGRYLFQHRWAEHPQLPSMGLRVRITGRHIVVVNPKKTAVFPKGVIAQGTLMWHAASSQWIIGTHASDRFASEVGGCSAGPDVVDLEKRIYWTC